MTNGEKFTEVFGFKHNATCPAPYSIHEERNFCDGCPFDGFWGKEYKECFKLKEEYDDGK